MEVVIVESPEAAAALAAEAIEQVLKDRVDPVLGLATGHSPRLTYQRLIDRYRRGLIRFSHARAFLLDEYVGLEPDHPAAFRSVIREQLIDHLDLPLEAVFAPDANSRDLRQAGADFERKISDAGGVDIQLLGIGRNGHIGFNEPNSSLGSRTRVKTLTESTRADNASFFGNDRDAVPRHALTQGIATILEARHVVLIATGAEKAGPLAAAVEGPLTSMVPASALQLHSHATVIVDEAAASRLAHAQYYRAAFDNKPAWQRI